MGGGKEDAVNREPRLLAAEESLGHLPILLPSCQEHPDREEKCELLYALSQGPSKPLLLFRALLLMKESCIRLPGRHDARACGANLSLSWLRMVGRVERKHTKMECWGKWAVRWLGPR